MLNFAITFTALRLLAKQILYHVQSDPLHHSQHCFDFAECPRTLETQRSSAVVDADSVHRIFDLERNFKQSRYLCGCQ